MAKGSKMGSRFGPLAILLPLSFPSFLRSVWRNKASGFQWFATSLVKIRHSLHCLIRMLRTDAISVAVCVSRKWIDAGEVSIFFLSVSLTSQQMNILANFLSLSLFLFANSPISFFTRYPFLEYVTFFFFWSLFFFSFFPVGFISYFISYFLLFFWSFSF